MIRVFEDESSKHSQKECISLVSLIANHVYTTGEIKLSRRIQNPGTQKVIWKLYLPAPFWCQIFELPPFFPDLNNSPIAPIA